MRILVCIKHVPESDARIEINGEGAGLRVAGEAYRMNRYDACALACAVQLAAAAGRPATIHAVTVGPPRAEAVLRRALGMGADAATHLVCGDDPLMSPFVVADWLVRWMRRQPFDLILCGVVSEDMMQGVTGPIMAERLGVPVACSVLEAALSVDGRAVTVAKEVDNGARVSMSLRLPAVLTIQSGAYRPRYPALSRMLKAAGAEIPAISVHPKTAPGQRIVAVGAPPAKTTTRFLEGSLAEKARALQGLLVQRGMV